MPGAGSAATPLNTPSNNAAEQCDDDNEYDEEEDVWDELRILTVRNTFVNKHMSYIDLRSKQVTTASLCRILWPLSLWPDKNVLCMTTSF